MIFCSCCCAAEHLAVPELVIPQCECPLCLTAGWEEPEDQVCFGAFRGCFPAWAQLHRVFIPLTMASGTCRSPDQGSRPPPSLGTLASLCFNMAWKSDTVLPPAGFTISFLTSASKGQKRVGPVRLDSEARALPSSFTDAHSSAPTQLRRIYFLTGT